MRQFHKGQRLIKLCDQKTRTEQQTLSRNVRQRQHLVDEIEQCEAEIQSLEHIMQAQQLNNVAVTKADLNAMRRQQALLLHKRQQLRLERTMRLENLDDIEDEIAHNHRQLAFLKRKEIKYTQWTHDTKKAWLLQKETANENELQENVSCQHQSN